MASRIPKSSSSGGSMGRSDAASKGAKASNQSGKLPSERATASRGGSKRSSQGSDKKSTGSKSGK